MLDSVSFRVTLTDGAWSCSNLSQPSLVYGLTSSYGPAENERRLAVGGHLTSVTLRHSFCSVTVNTSCLAALGQCRDSAVLIQGASLGLVSQRKVISSTRAWGAVHEGQQTIKVAHGLRRAHLNSLELLAVFIAPKIFPAFSPEFLILLRCDNSMTVAYINLWGGDSFSETAQTDSQHNNAEQCASCLSVCDTRPGQNERRNRPLHVSPLEPMRGVI